jgi:hypothetical protein
MVQKGRWVRGVFLFLMKSFLCRFSRILLCSASSLRNSHSNWVVNRYFSALWKVSRRRIQSPLANEIIALIQVVADGVQPKIVVVPVVFHLLFCCV